MRGFCPQVSDLLFPVESVTDPYLLKEPFIGYNKEQQLQFIVDSVDLTRKSHFGATSMPCSHLSLLSDWICTAQRCARRCSTVVSSVSPVCRHWIPVVRIVDCRAAERGETRQTVIYSHGNAEELSKGQILEMAQFAAEIDCDVILYEYAGYSITQDAQGNYLQCAAPLLSNSPDTWLHRSDVISEETCCESLEAVFKYATRAVGEQGLGLLPAQIVVYGRSLGTGVSIHLVSTLTEPVAMVLRSVYARGLFVCCSCFSGALSNLYLQLYYQVAYI